jgi:stearoyl-CoA desaturase (delta-9 desaturase)
VLASLVICLIASALVTQVAVLGTTIYLHRTATNMALTMHPAVEWLFKFSLWMTTGLSTKEWVAVHR